MTTVCASKLPSDALLLKYAAPVAYSDCYVAEVAGMVSHETFVRAFYTSPLFRIERAILKWCASRPSTDKDASALAAGASDKFAAWRVEDRSENQLLLVDFTGRTRSWFMVKTAEGSPGQGTLLYFGSAVVPRVDKTTGEKSMGPVFKALLGFHRVYSRALLRAASSRVSKQG
jgi:hypothetical protein